MLNIRKARLGPACLMGCRNSCCFNP